MTKLLIVESPGKIKKIKAILGSGWEVKASVGHIRQLSNEGQYSLGFEFEDDRINCRYSPKDDRAKQTIAQLKTAAKQASEVVLASDPDREGETIAWHIAQVLGLKQPKRVVYREITEAALRSAIAHPRQIDPHLVAAGRCRDCLDKLVGYRGSPLVWQLNNGAKSVGRVQSATLHLICQREREILGFVPQDYWSVFVDYAEGFRAFYHGGSQPNSPDEDNSIDDSGRSEKVAESTRVLTQAEADQLVQIAQAHPHSVKSIEGRQSAKKPPPPFTTSTLQQAAGSRLKFSPEQTMQVAQKLYEAGHITYMRTDSVQLSPEFCTAARNWLQTHDAANVPDKTAQQRSTKTAQEAHEAIRPTDLTKSSTELKAQLPTAEFQLYVLIWMRAIASQCKSAQLRKTRIVTQSGPIQWQARGQVVTFAGYTKYWKDISADTELPNLQNAQTLTLAQAAHDPKQTQPPPRYAEPKLVQLMERKGIGRPSTYAPTIATLKQRNYVQLLKDKLQPTSLGLEVDDFLGKVLPDLLEADFTAQMESALDAIAHGHQEWQQYLIGWNQSYFEPALKQAVVSLPTKPSGTFVSTRQLEKSRTKCPGCTKALSKVPTKKLKKGYFLKCEQGCKTEDGADLVQFWSEHSKTWQTPQSKSESQAATLTGYPCPVCKKPLEEYRYTKDGQSKALLRCSDAKVRGDRKHKDIVYFYSNETWWSPKLGPLKT